LQDTRTPLAVAVGTNILNLGLELLLIPGLGYGIAASALATAVAQNIGAGVYVRRIMREVRALDVPLAPHPASVGRLAIVARDLIIRTAALRGAWTLATAVAARMGEVEVAAHAIAFELWSLLALALDAIAIAGQAIVGRLLGAGDAGDARAAARRMIEIGVQAGVVAAALVIAFRTVLPALFTNDVAVQELTAFLLWFVAVFQPVNAVVFVLDGILIGAGDLGFLAIAMLVSTAVFIAGAVAVLALDLGLGWLWTAIGLFMVARGVTLTARFRTGRWAVTGATR
jgi:putative MATE family efflux protein